MHTLPWYQEWFNTDLYYRIYANRNHEEAAILAQRVTEWAPPAEYPHLLDLACGRGRHALHAAHFGYHVTGLDLSERAIATAKQLATEQALTNAHFVQGDMRDFELPKAFDIIINMFTSFGYFSEAQNKAVIARMSQHLRKNGRLILDYLNPSYVVQNLVEEESGHYEELQLQYRIKRWVKDQKVFKNIQLTNASDEHIEFTEEVNLYPYTWFQNAFEAAKLQPVIIAGNYQGEAFDADRSPRQIHVVERHSDR